jgi:hypothetical protein
LKNSFLPSLAKVVPLLLAHGGRLSFCAAGLQKFMHSRFLMGLTPTPLNLPRSVDEGGNPFVTVGLQQLLFICNYRKNGYLYVRMQSRDIALHFWVPYFTLTCHDSNLPRWHGNVLNPGVASSTHLFRRLVLQAQHICAACLWQ